MEIETKSRSAYIDGMVDWQDPVYKKIIAELPAGAKASDYVASVEVKASKAASGVEYSAAVNELVYNHLVTSGSAYAGQFRIIESSPDFGIPPVVAPTSLPASIHSSAARKLLCSRSSRPNHRSCSPPFSIGSASSARRRKKTRCRSRTWSASPAASSFSRARKYGNVSQRGELRWKDYRNGRRFCRDRRSQQGCGRIWNVL